MIIHSEASMQSKIELIFDQSHGSLTGIVNKAFYFIIPNSESRNDNCSIRIKKQELRRSNSIVNKTPQEKTSRFVEITNLMKLRVKAMRSGVWFRALNRIDRVLFNLTIKVTNGNIRSSSLLSRLLTVTTKLEGLLESKLSRATKEIGFPLACKLSLLAQKWGNKLAQTWPQDMEFARYLAVMKLNATQSLS
jgi:hypothetical protein